MNAQSAKDRLGIFRVVMGLSFRACLPVLFLTGCVSPSMLGFYSPSLGKISKEQYITIDKAGDDTREIELLQTITVYKLQIPAGSRVHFKNGEMQSIENKKAMTIETIEAPEGSTIYVDEHHHEYTAPTMELVSIILGGDHIYGKVSLRSGDKVTFDEQKLPKWVRLGSDFRWGSKTYRKGSEVWFNMAGEVSKSYTPEELRAMEQNAARCRMRCSDQMGNANYYCYNNCMGF